MASDQNLYNYRAPRSGQVETGLFSAKGRITPKAFLLRLGAAIFIYELGLVLNFSGIEDGISPDFDSFFRVLHQVISPVVLLAFIAIQAVKRVHDTNRSAWHVFLFFVLFQKGTQGTNDYGLDPIEPKTEEFYEDVEKNTDEGKEKSFSNDKEEAAIAVEETKPAFVESELDKGIVFFIGIVLVLVGVIVGYVVEENSRHNAVMDTMYEIEAIDTATDEAPVEEDDMDDDYILDIPLEEF